MSLDRENKNSHKLFNFDRKKDLWIIALILLLTFAIILRFYRLGAQMLWIDEPRIAYYVQPLFNKIGVLEALRGWGFEGVRAPLHAIFIKFSFQLLGFNTFAGRVPSTVFGILSVPIAFLLGRRIKNVRVGLLFALFMTFATVQIAWSRNMKMYQQLQFLSLLSFYLLERVMEKTSWRRFLPFLVSLPCLMLSHKFGFGLAFLIVLWFFFGKTPWFKEKITNFRKIGLKDWVGFFVLVSALVLVSRDFPWGIVWQRAHGSLGVDMNHWSAYVSHFVEEMDGLFYLAIPGAFLGVLKRRRNALYIVAFLVPLYFVSHYIKAMQHRYMFMLFPLLFAFAALTFDHIYERTRDLMKTRTEKFWLKSAGPVLILAITIGIFLHSANFTFLPGSQYDLGVTAPQGEFRPAHKYIENHWQENDVLLSTLPPTTWYCFKTPDYGIWFRVSYSGKPVQKGHIREVNQLKKIANDTHGWVFLDLMGRSRMNRKLLNYISKNFEQVKKNWRGVWVYQWE